MPTKAKRVCSYPGCRQWAVKDGRCPAHQYERQRKYERPDYHSWYNLPEWKSARASYLRDNPLCTLCLKKDPPVYRRANVVDHKTPHRGDLLLFWDETNWQGLCKECHDIKTAAEDGAFGNPVKRGDKNA